MSILTLGSPTAALARPGARARLAVTAIAVAGGALVITGAAAPWLSFFAGLQPITGLDGLNGRIAAGLGAATLAAALLFLATGRPALRWVVGLLGFGILAIAGWSGITLISTLAQLQADPLLVVQPGPGVPLLALGGSLVFATMFLALPAGDAARISISPDALRSPITGSMAAAGLVHLAVGPEHLAESAVLGGAMIAAGVAQLVLAGLVLRGGAVARTWPLVLTIGLNVVAVAAYVVAVTVGLPLVDVHGDLATVGAAGHEALAHVDGLTPLGIGTIVMELIAAACAAGILAIRRPEQGPEPAAHPYSGA